MWQRSGSSETGRACGRGQGWAKHGCDCARVSRPWDAAQASASNSDRPCGTGRACGTGQGQARHRGDCVGTGRLWESTQAPAGTSDKPWSRYGMIARGQGKARHACDSVRESHPCEEEKWRPYSGRCSAAHPSGGKSLLSSNAVAAVQSHEPRTTTCVKWCLPSDPCHRASPLAL